MSVAQPLLQAETWSASISEIFQIFLLLLSCQIAHNGQLETHSDLAFSVCFSYTVLTIDLSNTLISSNFVSEHHHNTYSNIQDFLILVLK